MKTEMNQKPLSHHAPTNFNIPKQLPLPPRDGSLLDSLPDLSDQPRTITSFMSIIQRLKLTPRTGWVNYKVPLPESCADHMYRMAIIAMICPADSHLNINKCIRLALVHDMAESLVGDITPLHNISKTEKHYRETMALRASVSLLPEELSAQAAEIIALFDEYEKAETAEAILVKDIDKYELMLQTYEYERQNEHLGSLKDFIIPIKLIQNPTIKGWAEELLSEREAYWKRRAGIIHIEENGIEDKVGTAGHNFNYV